MSTRTHRDVKMRCNGSCGHEWVPVPHVIYLYPLYFSLSLSSYKSVLAVVPIVVIRGFAIDDPVEVFKAINGFICT